MQSLPASLLCELASVEVQPDRVLGPFVTPLRMYRLNDCNEGAFSIFESSAGDSMLTVSQRERIKMQYLVTRLVAELSRAPEKKEAEDGAQPMLTEDGEEEEEESTKAPLARVFLVPVSSNEDNAAALLRENATDPEVVDYRGVSAFAWYLVLNSENAHGVLCSALNSVIASNSLRADGPPPRAAGGKGRGAGRGGGRGGGSGGDARSAFKESVCALNGPNPSHDLGDKCLFNTKRTSEDWSLTFRSARDLAFMLATLYKWEYAPDKVTVSDVARVFSGGVGDNGRASFFGLPQGATLPLRQPNEEMVFGEGRGLLALDVDPNDMDLGSRAKLVRFPLLRSPSSVPDIARRDRVRFGFLKAKPPMVNQRNQEGAFRLLQMHVAREAANGCGDLRALADEGTVLVRSSGGSLEAPLLPPEGGRLAGSAYDDEIDSEGWWARSGVHDFELVAQYDTYGGPTSKHPGRSTTRLRITACASLRSMGAAVGAHLRVEEYGRVETRELALRGDGLSVVDSGVLRTFEDGVGGKRRCPVELATAASGSPGPLWPVRDDWAALPGTRGGGTTWQPKRRLFWTRPDDGRQHVVVALRIWSEDDNQDGGDSWDAVDRDDPPPPHVGGVRFRGRRIRIMSREVGPPRWVSVPLDPHGSAVVPSAQESRDRHKRRLEVDAEEAMCSDTLMPESYGLASRWFRTEVASFRASGRRPEGFALGYPSLSTQMNYYAVFLQMLEYGMDVRYYHPTLFKCYMSVRHVAKTAIVTVKPLHVLLFGPPGAGKSFSMDGVKRMMPPGFAVPVTHVSAQHDFADGMPSVDWRTSHVQFQDEANMEQLGMQDTPDGQSNARNATSHVSTEFKERLTNRRPTSSVLAIREGTRTHELYEASHDVVHVINMNNFPQMSPAMESRFNACCFYRIPRMDAIMAKMRAPCARRTGMFNNFADMQRLLYFLQYKFDTLQAAGICAPVPEEGWKVFASEFERVLMERFPFAINEGQTLGRKLEDAFQYVRMIVNSHAVYLTFAHPRAPYLDLSNISLECFQFTERLICPDQRTMVLALSFLQQDLFPAGLVNVVDALRFMVLDLIAAHAQASDNGTHDLSMREVPLMGLYGDLMARAESTRGGGDAGLATHASPPQPHPPTPWRSLCAQLCRLESVMGPDDFRNAERFDRSGLPILDRKDVSSSIPKLQYVVAFEESAPNEAEFMKRAMDAIYTRMHAREAGSMPKDHVGKALGALRGRSMRDTDSKGVQCAKATLNVVSLEEVTQTAQSRMRQFRLLVSKSALDEQHNGGLSIDNVFKYMKHRFTPPGTYLFNKPHQSEASEELLPQLAFADYVNLHKNGCVCALTATQAHQVTSEADEVCRRIAEMQIQDDTVVLTPEQRFPWASRQFVENRGCNCWRSRRISIVSGCAIPAGVRTDMNAILGGGTSATDAGLGDAAPRELDCPEEELGWIAHVKRLVGTHPHEMSVADMRRAGMEHAHPSSRHWISADGRVECYPRTQERELAAQPGRAASGSAAREEIMFSRSAGRDMWLAPGM